MIEISPHQTLRQARDELDRLYLEYHLKKNGWRLGPMSATAGMERSYLYRLAHKLGIPIGYEVTELGRPPQKAPALQAE